MELEKYKISTKTGSGSRNYRHDYIIVALSSNNYFGMQQALKRFPTHSLICPSVHPLLRTPAWSPPSTNSRPENNYTCNISSPGQTPVTMTWPIYIYVPHNSTKTGEKKKLWECRAVGWIVFGQVSFQTKERVYVSIVRPIIGHLEKNDIKIHWKRGITNHSAHHKKKCVPNHVPRTNTGISCILPNGIPKQGREREYLERALDQLGRDGKGIWMLVNNRKWSLIVIHLSDEKLGAADHSTSTKRDHMRRTILTGSD